MASQDWSRQPEAMLARLRKEFATSPAGPQGKEAPYRVPKFLRDVKPSLFEPDTVSLVPIRPELGLHMKVSFYHIFLKWYSQSKKGFDKTEVCSLNFNTSTSRTPGCPWDHFLEALDLDNDVTSACRLYGIGSSSSVLAGALKHIVAVDALFLVLFLRYSYHRYKHSKLPEHVNQEIHQLPDFRPLATSPSAIWRDVFLLENQISMKIVKKVWLQMPDKSGSNAAGHELKMLLREVMKDQYLRIWRNWSNGTQDAGQTALVRSVLKNKDFTTDCEHLLDGLHYVVSYSPPQQPDNPLRYVNVDESASSPGDVLPGALRLRRVGIRLQSDCTFIHQVKFEKGLPLRWSVLHLPCLRIADHTEAILRNLAVFETLSCQKSESAGHRQALLIPYLILMDKLLNTKGDVRLMKKEDIIVNCLGSNHGMLCAWHTLAKRLTCSSYQNPAWDQELNALMKRYRSMPRQLNAEFKAKYFARPWAVVSWVGGVLLLVLTGLQTLFTILSYRDAQNRFYPAQTPSPF